MTAGTMATALNNPVQWDKSLSLDRKVPLYFSDHNKDNSTSSLHIQQLKQKILESRKAFLQLEEDRQPSTNRELKNKTSTTTPKKVSFKVKKTSSIYRRNNTQKVTTISATKVSELTKKFNGIINETNSNSLLEQPKVRKLVRRVNSQRSTADNSKPSVKMRDHNVTRKPSVKTKPIFNIEDKGIIIVRRKAISRRVSDKTAITMKIEKQMVAPRPQSLSLSPTPPPKPQMSPSVRATIEIFERRNSQTSPSSPTSQVPTKAKVPERPPKSEQILKLCQTKCQPENPPLSKPSISEEMIVSIKPNTSFLWSINKDKSPSINSVYDFVKPPDKIYEELSGYEIIGDNYEYCEKENIYETLPVDQAPPLLPRRQQTEPLPPRPPSRTSYCTIQQDSNCYESIYNPDGSNLSAVPKVDSNYESIYNLRLESNRNSIVSSDQQSNSVYGRSSLMNWGEENVYKPATSELGSDRSDDWVDVTDNEDNGNDSSEIIIIRERQKPKKTTGWSKQYRDQWSKSPRKLPLDQDADSDADHHYESLYNNSREESQDDDYDSFDSDTESESSFNKMHDSGVDIANSQLPVPPNSQTYVLTRLAATAGKHMRKLRRNWSLTKNDISKSLSRMTKRKSRTDLEIRHELHAQEPAAPETIPSNMEDNNNSKNMSRKSFLEKFRRSMSLSAESASELTSNLDSKPKSTFYLTDEIDIDGAEEAEEDKNPAVSPVQRHSRVVIRPQSPPPPAPVQKPGKDKRSTSWYAEVGLFKNSENLKRHTTSASTFWYAEVGLYQGSKSTPSTSSAENSGTNTNTLIKTNFINQENSDDYYNQKNADSDYYNNSIASLSSTETKKDQSMNSLSQEVQMRFLDEPLYQFYDAAVLESVCHDGVSEIDCDGYEEVGDKNPYGSTLRPSAMELVAPKRNSIAFNRTLWCEIPEVIQSSVLSTLSTHQKKLQEAKFEMVTSEASYLNSLNVLINHFIASLENNEIVSKEECDTLFGKVTAVKSCSEKLLYDLEKCWQDNILLHGVCEIIQKHAEENFNVYVPYCENQILLDDTLKRIKERPAYIELLRQLEASSTCQSLTLYSFLMLPMQRITRWPLLVDAVLKRLSPQDTEYITCQYALATLNKIVGQCNEGARRKERENEMKKLVSLLEFGRNVPRMEIFTENRWLVRSGAVTQMTQRTDEIKLTFGKRFVKLTLHLFLFNDYLFVAKPKNDNQFVISHYCPRNLIELSSTDLITSIPVKESQGRHLIFLTMLENQNEKTVELLLSCNSESDKERWIEALTPPRSEDPDETLYECWDCPQVTAIHTYLASQPDELALSRGDVINVLRKMADGWYHGERIRDGQTGWFPANYTAEIANPHVRSRNLKQRYRLLAFSENYLNQNKTY